MGDAELGRRMQCLLKTCCKTLYKKLIFKCFMKNICYFCAILSKND